MCLGRERDSFMPYIQPNTSQFSSDLALYRFCWDMTMWDIFVGAIILLIVASAGPRLRQHEIVREAILAYFPNICIHLLYRTAAYWFNVSLWLNPAVIGLAIAFRGLFSDYPYVGRWRLLFATCLLLYGINRIPAEIAAAVTDRDIPDYERLVDYLQRRA